MAALDGWQRQARWAGVPYAVLKKSGDDNASTGLVHHGQSWVLGQAGYRLRGAQVQRLLDYTWLEGRDPGGKDYTESPAFLAASGFRELLAPSAAGAGSCGNPGAMIDGHPEYAQCWGLTL